MTIIFYKILIVFAMVAIGYLCHRTNIIPIEANQYLIGLLINVTGPCLIVTSISNKHLTSDTLTATVQMLAGTLIYFIVGFAAAWLIVKLLRIPQEDIGVYTSILTAQNTGFMGFPISKAAFGNEGMYFMVLNNMMLSIYMYSVGLLQIGLGEKKKGAFQWRETFRSMVNMCSIAALAGIALLFLGIKLPPFLNDVMTPVGDANIPISMIVLGVQLGDSNIKNILTNRKLVILTLISLILWPFLTFLAVNWLPLYTFVKLTMVFASAFPAMIMIVALAAHEGKNVQLAAEGVALSTFGSILTLPLVTVLLTLYYGI